MRLGLLTGGGDCPGLNAVIRAVVRRADAGGDSVLGIKDGWAGLVRGEVEPLTRLAVSGILSRGGTILGSSRTNPVRDAESAERCSANLRRYALDALVAVGGDDTLGAALEFTKRGIAVVGVPKTIDNDVGATDYTFGFDTAVAIATEAIDRLHTTAEAHSRVMVVEVMGRHTGWIAAYAGIAGGAHCILVPERPVDLAWVCAVIEKRRKRGRHFSIVVVAEGVQLSETKGYVVQEEKPDAYGHVRLGGIGHVIAREIESRTGIETRVTVLGHVQRGGSPTAFDRILATRLGVAAVDMVRAGEFGKMPALRGDRIVPVPLAEAVAKPKSLPPEILDVAETFFG